MFLTNVIYDLIFRFLALCMLTTEAFISRKVKNSESVEMATHNVPSTSLAPSYGISDDLNLT